MFDFEHISLMQPSSIEDAISGGFVEKTTYKNAFEQVGLYDKFKLNLTINGVSDESVYRVTPKGNGLVILVYDFGPKENEPQVAKVPQPTFAF